MTTWGLQAYALATRTQPDEVLGSRQRSKLAHSSQPFTHKQQEGKATHYANSRSPKRLSPLSRPDKLMVKETAGSERKLNTKDSTVWQVYKLRVWDSWGIFMGLGLEGYSHTNYYNPDILPLTRSELGVDFRRFRSSPRHFKQLRLGQERRIDCQARPWFRMLGALGHGLEFKALAHDALRSRRVEGSHLAFCTRTLPGFNR